MWTTNQSPLPGPARWCPDPYAVRDGTRRLRWWDGEGWTPSVREWRTDRWVEWRDPEPLVAIGNPNDNEPGQPARPEPLSVGDLDPEARPAPVSHIEVAPETSGLGDCLSCGTSITDPGWNVCPHCGSTIAKHHFEAGDVANGHVLGNDNVWYPVQQPQPYRPSPVRRSEPSPNSSIGSSASDTKALYIVLGLGAGLFLLALATGAFGNPSLGQIFAPPTPAEVAANAGCGALEFEAYRTGFESTGLRLTTADVEKWIAEGGCS